MDSRKPLVRCAIYTRKSHEDGLDQHYNSLDAQRDAAEAYIRAHLHENWVLIPDDYTDAAISGGTMKRPALQRLIQDIKHRKVDMVVVYKMDRLTRSLFDFAKIAQLLQTYETSFASVTEKIDTSTAMGKLHLNMLLSFAQFERELAGERIRDKVAASKQKGYWLGGQPPLGYDVKDKELIVLMNCNSCRRRFLVNRAALSWHDAGCRGQLRKSCRTNTRQWRRRRNRCQPPKPVPLNIATAKQRSCTPPCRSARGRLPCTCCPKAS